MKSLFVENSVLHCLDEEFAELAGWRVGESNESRIFTMRAKLVEVVTRYVKAITSSEICGLHVVLC